MANYLTTDTDLTAVANAIRTKGGTSASLAFPTGFVNAIDAIPTGGGGGEAEVAELIERSATTIENDEATSVGASAFYSYTALTSVKLPNVKTIGTSAFQLCNGLTTVVFPTINYRVDGSAFRQCSNLTAADFYSPSSLGAQTFYSCTRFTTLVLRGNSVATLGNISCFNGSPFASNGTGGTLYVPSALISSYQSATNWSTILGYANNSIQAIEGSQYENYYADGAPIT